MRKIVLVSIVAAMFFACGQKTNKQDKATEQKQLEEVVLTVDEVLEQAFELADKEVVVKGTVMHVCKHGGARCFLMGSNEDVTIRVEAGEKIGAFEQEQMGSDLEIRGILKEVKTEADAHNPGKEHGEHDGHDQEEDAETEAAHQQIAQNQEAAEVVFFIQGIKIK